jgi:hypothetical protein
MSEWITDRLPDYEDMFSGLVWGQVKDGTPCLREWTEVKRGEPWMPIKEPEPYVKPEPQRWKPETNQWYYYLTEYGDIQVTNYSVNEIDGKQYNFGNCFETCAQADEAARRVRELLLNYHKELNNE